MADDQGYGLKKEVVELDKLAEFMERINKLNPIIGPELIQLICVVPYELECQKTDFTEFGPSYRTKSVFVMWNKQAIPRHMQGLVKPA